MRRLALLGLGLTLAGCQFAGNPLDGFHDFIADTHTIHPNPTQPVGSEETMRRITTQDAAIPALLPEPGNIWPGPLKPLPTLQELQNPNSQELLPPPNVPATAPPLVFPPAQTP